VKFDLRSNGALLYVVVSLLFRTSGIYFTLREMFASLMRTGVASRGGFEEFQ